MYSRSAKFPSFRCRPRANGVLQCHIDCADFVVAGCPSKDLTDEYKAVREQDFRECVGTMSSVKLTFECGVIMSFKGSVPDSSLAQRTRRKQEFRLLSAS
jgi:hypothetical protein